MEHKFILASSSPRRKELLGLIGIQPLIIKPEVDETRLPKESIETFLRRVTIEKGQDIYQKEYFHIPIISADTIVYCDDHLIGKPRNRQEAGRFLELLSDNVHEVWTGLCIHYKGEPYYEFARTRVFFSPINQDEIEHYLDHEHYMDKAGAYAIQGRASVFVRKIDGCYFNVMGFPLNIFYQMLKKLGISI